MFAKSAIVSLAVVAAAAPAFSAPVPAESRALKLPAGAVGDLIKSLGKGILSGGAVTGLLSLLDGGSDSSDAAPAARDLDLEARAGLASALEKLVGVGAESLESVLKKAILGGVASGVAVEGVNAATGQSKRAGIPTAVVDDAAKAAEKGLASILGNGAADGLGSALGGLGVGAIISKLFGNSDSSTASSKRGFQDLSDEEVNTLLEYIGQMNGATTKRAISSSVGKGLAGVVAGLAATQGAESIIDEIKKLLRRETGLDELD